ncbi:MAG: nucleotide exchange factor GrpE, partial [Clostridia bacterium]
GEPGTVCEVLQKGYQLEGIVIRHAMVKVVPE